MELRHLRYVDAVAEARGFSRAAERLGIAQPPLSRQIRELERELGVELFDRDSRPVRLTEAGRLFHEQALALLAGVDRLRRSMRQLTDHGRRRLVIGVVGSVVYGALPKVIRRLRDAAPGLDVDLRELTTLEQIAALKEGRIDAGLGRVRIDDAAVRREVLQEERLVAAIGAGHPLRDRPAVTLAEMAAARLVVYPSQPRPSYADQVLSLLRDRGLVPADVIEMREVHVALGLVAADAGVAIVPASLSALRGGDVVYLPIADAGAVSPVIMSVRAGDVSPETQLFAQTARALFQRGAPERDTGAACIPPL